MSSTKTMKKPDVKKRTCPHYAYSIIDGELRCADCGELSPKARLVNGVIVPIEPEVTCPECGHKFRVTPAH